ncbi:MAG: iron chelate uptake ABC transporter family permease subunit, partial [Hyphomicrobium sp.]
AGALTSLALNLSPNPFASTEIMFWLMGSLTDRSLIHVWLATPLILIGIAMLLTTGRDLEALSLGEDAAKNLGVDLTGLRFKVIAGSALAVGAATAVAGAISFIGLIVPHVIRPFVGHSPQRLLLPCLFGGAAMVLFADVLLRFLSPQGDLRLGVLSALIGAPFFLWRVLASRREMAP